MDKNFSTRLWDRFVAMDKCTFGAAEGPTCFPTSGNWVHFFPGSNASVACE
jgi:hypothetical protein